MEEHGGVDEGVVPVVDAVGAEDVVEVAFGVAERGDLLGVDAGEAAEDHGGGVGGVEHGGDAGGLAPVGSAILLEVEVSLVVVVLGLAVDEVAHFAGGHLLAAEDGAGAVVAGLAHRVGQAGRADERLDFEDFLDGGGTGDGAVDVLARLEGGDDQRAVQMALGEDGDGVEVRVADGVLERRHNRHVEEPPVLLGPFGHEVAHRHMLDVRMALEQRHEVAAEAPAADEADAYLP